jgi:hypothetical protein
MSATCAPALTSSAAKASPRWPRFARPTCVASSHRRPRTPAPTSQGPTVVALRCFFRFSVESDHLECDPAACCAHPKGTRCCPAYSTAQSFHAAGRARQGRSLESPARREGRARPPAARAVRLRRPAPLGTARSGLRGHRPRPRPAPDTRTQSQGRAPARRTDPPWPHATVHRLRRRASGHTRPLPCSWASTASA